MDKRMTAGRFIAALAVSILLDGGALAANQIVANCASDAELRSDLAAIQSSGGGMLTFSCGFATIVLTQDLPTVATETTVDGGGKITISGGNSRRIFVVDAGTGLSLKDIVLSNGSAIGDGGAIYSNGSLSMEDVTIRDSFATFSGGAFVTYGPAQIDDSEIAYNSAASGGGVYARFGGAPVTIRDSVLHHNETKNQVNAPGGAVFLWDGASVTIQRSEISENKASAGAGIYNGFANSAVSVEDSRIVGNVLTSGGGAGIDITGGPLVLVRSEVAGNASGGSGGGLYYHDGSSAMIVDSTFHGNYAGGLGGGVYISNSTGVKLTNTTISTNESFNGAGLAIGDSAVSLVHVTIAHNSPQAGSSGFLHLSGASGRTTTIRNSLLANNGTVNCSTAGGSLVSEDGNVSTDTSCGAVLNKGHDRLVAAALLGPLGFHGGPTPTHVPGPGSDAVDAGVLVNAPPTDQRGVARPQGASVDAGAVEVAGCGPGSDLCGDANDSLSVTTADALRTLQFSVGSASECPLWLCDYNGNGSISATDALGILRAAVGLQTNPACPPKWDCRVAE
jgi:predicted outer membrane repeat protein